MSTPFVTGHPYQFWKVGRFPVGQVHFGRCETCGTIAVALIVPSLLTRLHPFTLWSVSLWKLLSGHVSTLTPRYETGFWFFFSPLRIFLHPIYGVDTVLFPIIKSLLKALCLTSHYVLCMVFWRILDSAFILVGE